METPFPFDDLHAATGTWTVLRMSLDPIVRLLNVWIPMLLLILILLAGQIRVPWDLVVKAHGELTHLAGNACRHEFGIVVQLAVVATLSLTPSEIFLVG